MILKFATYLDSEPTHPGGEEWEKVNASVRLFNDAYAYIAQNTQTTALIFNDVFIMNLTDFLLARVHYESRDDVNNIDDFLEEWNSKVQVIYQTSAGDATHERPPAVKEPLFYMIYDLFDAEGVPEAQATYPDLTFQVLDANVQFNQYIQVKVTGTLPAFEKYVTETELGEDITPEELRVELDHMVSRLTPVETRGTQPRNNPPIGKL